jgi:broad specificity phosphatase PhoE
MKKVYFVRHGETEGNVGKFFQTHDTPLTKKGHEGAKAIAERLQYLKIDAILASPFFRAQQTASYISEAIKLPIETVESSHELQQSFVVRGKLWDTEEGQEFIHDRNMNFFDSAWKVDGAENHAMVLERIKSTIEILEKHPADNIVLVSHGLFIRYVATYLLLSKNTDSPTHKLVSGSLHQLSNVAITEFIFDGSDWSLLTWNDRAHFADN